MLLSCQVMGPGEPRLCGGGREGEELTRRVKPVFPSRRFSGQSLQGSLLRRKLPQEESPTVTAHAQL